MYLFIFKSKNDNKPNFAPLHFSINHVACNIHITSTWTPIDACADRLWPTKYQKTLHRRDENNHHHPDLFDTLKEQKNKTDSVRALLYNLLYHCGDGFKTAGSRWKLAVQAACFHLATWRNRMGVEKRCQAKIHIETRVTWGNSWKAPAVSWFRSEDPPITTTGLCKASITS